MHAALTIAQSVLIDLVVHILHASSLSQPRWDLSRQSLFISLGLVSATPLYLYTYVIYFYIINQHVHKCDKSFYDCKNSGDFVSYLITFQFYITKIKLALDEALQDVNCTLATG